MKLKALLTIVALMVVGGAMPANARPYDGSMWSTAESESATSTSGKHSRSANRARRTHNSSYSGGLGGRPAKWCGWWMRTQKGGGPEYNLAANWRRYGSATGAQVGAIVVWPHHVGIITGRAANGQWIVKSGNDSGRVRERARSVSGAVFRI